MVGSSIAEWPGADVANGANRLPRASPTAPIHAASASPPATHTASASSTSISTIGSTEEVGEEERGYHNTEAPEGIGSLTDVLDQGVAGIAGRGAVDVAAAKPAVKQAAKHARMREEGAVEEAREGEEGEEGEEETVEVAAQQRHGSIDTKCQKPTARTQEHKGEQAKEKKAKPEGGAEKEADTATSKKAPSAGSASGPGSASVIGAYGTASNGAPQPPKKGKEAGEEAGKEATPRSVRCGRRSSHICQSAAVRSRRAGCLAYASGCLAAECAAAAAAAGAAPTGAASAGPCCQSSEAGSECQTAAEAARGEA